jgi:hypothetical protein
VPDLESGLTGDFRFHNTVRLHSAIGYVTPADKLAGRAEAIWAQRKRKLAAAEARRRAASALSRSPSGWKVRNTSLFVRGTSLVGPPAGTWYNQRRPI